MITESKVVLKDNKISYEGVEAHALKRSDNENFCRLVFIGPNFVVKIDNLKDFYGSQTDQEISAIRSLQKIGYERFVPKILDYGTIIINDVEVPYIVQERIHGTHASPQEAISFKSKLKALPGMKPYRHMLCDLHEYNIIKKSNGEFVAVDLGI